jgi:hypothetical protein
VKFDNFKLTLLTGMVLVVLLTLGMLLFKLNIFLGLPAIILICITLPIVQIGYFNKMKHAQRIDKDLVFGKSKIGPADILAFSAFCVSIIFSVGILLSKIDLKVGGGIIVALIGGSAIAQVVKAGHGK